MKIGAVILAGGKSSRMGVCKALLPFGNSTIIGETAKKLGFFEELIISADDEEFEKYGKIVKDIFKNCGPMGGIHSALCNCKSDALFVTACDMPLIRQETIKKLCGMFECRFDGIAVKHYERIEPLFALYKKETADFFEKELLSKKYSMRRAIEKMNMKYVTAEQITELPQEFYNINTLEKYKELSAYEN